MSEQNQTGNAAVDSEGDDSTVIESPEAKPSAKSSTGSGSKLLSVVLFLLLIGIVGAGGYFGWKQLQGQQGELTTVATSLQQSRQQLGELQQQWQRATKQQAQTQQAEHEMLTAITQRLESHNKRIMSLSTTNRDDWLLAEAEYLLRLASQRLLMERGTLGAEALLMAADDILRGLDDAELFGVRQALAQDLNALKLSGRIDREGLYLQLAALAEQLQNLSPSVVPVAPARNNKPEVQADMPAVQEDASTPAADGEADTGSFWVTVKQSFFNALSKFSDYLTVRHHEEPVDPLMAPEHQVYLSQNLRLMIERAQLAMLREEPRIYQHSLSQAQAWLKKYYSLNSQSENLAEQLEALKNQPVSQTLPTISASLNELKAYTERLHKLAPAPVKPSTDSEEA